MKMIKFSPLSLLSAAFVLCLFSGCSDPQQRAIKSLHKKEYAFEVSDYLRAAALGDFEAIHLFWEAGMEVDATDAAGSSALLVASEKGHLPIVEALVERGVDVNHLDAKGRSALFYAAGNGEEEVVAYLLGKGADPLLADKENWTPLTWAAHQGEEKTTKQLAPASKDHLQEALLIASLDGHTEVIDALISQGAYVNARSADNRTPLMFASSKGNFDAVKLLLKNRANRYALDDEGRTAAQMADANGFFEIAEYLAKPPEVAELSDLNRPSLEEDAPIALMEPEQVAALPPAKKKAMGLDSSARAKKKAKAKTSSEGNKSSKTKKSTANAPTVASDSGEAQREVPEDLGEQWPAAEVPEGLVDELVMIDYRESYLPFVLREVEGEMGVVQLLYNPDSSLEVYPDDMIGDTGFRVVSIAPKTRSSKLTQGERIDVSEMVVADTRTEQEYTLVANQPAHSQDNYAILFLPSAEQEFAVKQGDTFWIKDEEENKYFVEEVRPTQVVVYSMATGNIKTIAREAVSSWNHL